MAGHNDLGKLGEQLAEQHLQRKGYSILERNWRSGRAEIDIVARMGDTLAFVEVKTRNTEFFGLPESFVTRKKQQQMADAAEAYCTAHTGKEMDVRYDVVSVIINEKEQKVMHIEDAFFPDNLDLF